MEAWKNAPIPPGAFRDAVVREHLDRVVRDFTLSGATRRSRLLRYLVEKSLEDDGESLKESVIATEVFDRAPDYDPQIDSVVRVEVGRLRSRLTEYYDKAGRDEPVRIEIPKGGYRPVFVFRESEPEAGAVGERPYASRGRRGWGLVAAGIAVVAMFVAGLIVWRLRVSAPATPVAVAVLPFLNLTGDTAEDYLGDGISEELTDDLAEFNDLRVVARTSAFQYKGKSVDVREIGRRLGVGAVLEGSIARRDGRFHVVAQLIRTSDGFHLWSRTYDATPGEIPAIETAVAWAARETLAPAASVTAETQLSAARNPEAHDLYIRAVYELNLRTAASTKHAMDLASQAAAKDGSFAQPYVLMAAGESQLNTLRVQAPDVGAKRAWEDVAKALELDPGNSGAHAQRALLAYIDRWDWPQAEREFRLALATGSHGSAENLYGWCLMTRGRFEESRRRLQAAAELDPLSLGPQLNQAQELVAERNYAEAKRKVEQIFTAAPANPIAEQLASNIAALQKDCPTADARSRKLLDRYPKVAAGRLVQLGADFACGRPVHTQAVLDAISRESLIGYVSPYSIAAGFAVEGDVERTLTYLQKAAELREPQLMGLRVDRVFDPYQHDPRFIALERRIGLRE